MTGNMLLAIDIGNTNTVIGVFDNEELIVDWRIATGSKWTADDFYVVYKNLFEFDDRVSTKEISNAVISSVVPVTISPLREMCEKYFNISPLIIDNNTKTGLKILYDNPSEVGADRLVNATAAYIKYGGPVIVVDFGTATTFCYISKEGEYCGGIIVPGMKISIDALFQKAAKLPKVEMIKPPRVIGKNTINSIQSGIINGYTSLVDGIISKMETEIKEKPFVVATGGLAELISCESTSIKEVNQMLTLDGLRILFEMNR